MLQTAPVPTKQAKTPLNQVVSFYPHPLPALFLAPFYRARCVWEKLGRQHHSPAGSGAKEEEEGAEPHSPHSPFTELATEGGRKVGR